MRKWWVKAIIQGVLSLFPNRNQLNRLFQKYITRSIEPDLNTFRSRAVFVPTHLAHYREHHMASALPDRILELGTGWFPIVPLGLYLCGVDQVLTIDLNRLLTVENLRALLHTIRTTPIETLREILPDIVESRHAQLRRMVIEDAMKADEILAQFGIVYRIADARHLDLPDASADYIISNLTFEHIPPDVLSAIIAEFRRIIRPDGLMSHLTDMSDHYAHFDRNITAYHFLRYSSSAWRWFNNALQYQSRLRVSDYRQLHTKNGFDIIAEDNRDHGVEALNSVPLAEEFRHYAQEDLLPVVTWQVSRPVTR